MILKGISNNKIFLSDLFYKSVFIHRRNVSDKQFDFYQTKICLQFHIKMLKYEYKQETES